MATPYYNASYPVVVQGQPVSNTTTFNGGNFNNAPHSNNHHDSTFTQNFDTETGQPWTKSSAQPKQCRDMFWAVLFYAHLVAIGCLGVIYLPQMSKILATASSGGGRRQLAVWSKLGLQKDSTHLSRVLQEDGSSSTTGDGSFNVSSILSILSICGLTGFVMSSLALVMIMNFAAGLIKVALIFHVAFMATLAVLALLSGNTGLCILLSIGAALSLCFTVGAWSRIPFGAANLTTAVTAVRANIGLAFFAYLSLVMIFVWTIVWNLSAVSTIFILNDCDSSFQCSNQSPAGTLVIFLFLLSYHWTSQVIFNVVHVTTAGTVGTWWFAPQEANSCCSKAIGDSYVRAMTWSFGSICLGSLLVAIIEATRDLVRSLRDQNDSMLACLADCLLGCLESWAEYFCKWAYVYVGLYGYGFIEASSNVMTLFRSRGWTTIITDSLVETVLFMVAIGVGVLTGIIGLVIGAAEGQSNAAIISFFVGFVVGWVMCATLFSVVSSAVNTVIVCYAEAPNEFQINHPQLSDHMRAAWRQAWPVEFRY